MGIFEAIVVFFISWWVVLLPTLSAGTRSQHEAGAVIPGSEQGAPEKINWKPKVIIASIGAGIITLALYVSLNLGWFNYMIPKD